MVSEGCWHPYCLSNARSSVMRFRVNILSCSLKLEFRRRYRMEDDSESMHSVCMLRPSLLMTAGFDGEGISQKANDQFSPSGRRVFTRWEKNHKQGHRRRRRIRSFQDQRLKKRIKEYYISKVHISSHNVQDQLLQQGSKIWNSK